MASLATDNWVSVNNSIVVVIIFLFCIYNFCQFRFRSFELSDVIIYIISAIYSICLVLGCNLILFSTSAITSPKTWLKVIGLFPFFCVVVFNFLDKKFTLNIQRMGSENSLSEFVNRLGSKKRLFLWWALIFIAWVPYLIVCHPGILGYDAAVQLNEFARGTITTHHPLLHTLLLGYLVKMNNGNFSELSVRHGVMIYSLLQMICLSFSFACMENFIIRKKSFGIFSGFTLLVMMFLPINPIMAISTTKNTLFTAFFILNVLMLYKFLENNKVIDSLPFDLIYIVVSFFSMAFLNQMFYVFVLTSVIIFIICKKKKKIAIVSILSIFIFTFWNGPITKKMGVINDPNDRTRETMSLPIAQLSRTATFYSDSISHSDLKHIKQYVPEYKNYQKFPAVTDPLKNTFNAQYFRNDPKRFVDLWFKLGIRHPVSYFDAFGKLTLPLWYPNFYKDPSIPEPYWEYNNIYTFSGLTKRQIQRQGFYTRRYHGVFSPLNKLMESLTYKSSFIKLPFLPFLFSSGLPFWLILADIAIFTFKREWRFLGILVLPLLLWCTLLLGPEVILRYTYPLICCEPIFLLPIFDQFHMDENNLKFKK